MQDIEVSAQDLFFLSVVSQDILRRHRCWWCASQRSVGALDIFDHFFGDDDRADVGVLGKEDDDLVTRNSDSHVGTAGIGHSERDELAHHQV